MNKKIQELRFKWDTALSNALSWFPPSRCFRRPESKSINRALFDLVMMTATRVEEETAKEKRNEFLSVFSEIIDDEDFQDLISRAVDHKSRTERRFEFWNNKMAKIGL